MKTAVEVSRVNCDGSEVCYACGSNAELLYDVRTRQVTDDNTGLFEMIVGGLTTCHTQYT